MKPAPLFYIQREGAEAGPYDVVQMAGLLRRKIIDSETPTRLKDREEWMPFSWQPQFAVAREMPADAVSTRTAELDAEAQAQAAGPIPRPSPETLLKLGAFAVIVLLTFAASYLLARLDPALGQILIVLGGGIALLAQVMILLRVMDEDYLTMLLFAFLPLYDIYYFASNIGLFARWFALKYIGAAMSAGALLGLGGHW